MENEKIHTELLNEIRDLRIRLRDAQEKLIAVSHECADGLIEPFVDLFPPKALLQSEEHYRALFNSMTEGFALHEIVLNHNNIPCDYKFLDVNPAFESLTGWKRSNIIGKLQSLVFPNEMHWVEIFGKVALTGEPANFTSYSPTLKKYYEVYGYRFAPMRFATFFKDITERKNAEEALRRSENQKTLILENAGELIAFFDVNCCVKWANNAFLKSCNMSLHEIIGRKCYQVWGLDMMCDDCPVIRVLKTGKPQEGELTPENQPNWPSSRGHWMVRAAPVKDDKGNIIGVIEISHDITKQKENEKALRESQERLSIAVNAAQIGLFDWHIRSGDLYITPYYEAIFGYTPGSSNNACKFNDWSRHIHPDDKSQVEKEIYMSMTDRKDYKADYRIVRPDGEIRWITASAKFYYNDYDVASRMFGAIIDITERKKVEDNLRENEERLRIALEAANLGTWDLDLNTGIAVHSFADSQVSGFKEIQPDWNSALKNALPEVLSAVRQAHVKAKETGKLSFEFKMKSHDGRIHWFAPHGRMQYDSRGRPIRIIGIIADITERKQMEEALRISEESFRLILKDSPVTVSTFDCDLRYTWIFNPRHGFTNELVIGKRPDELISPDDAAQLMELLRNVLRTGKAEQKEVVGRTNGIKWLYHDIVKPIRDENGHVIGLTAIQIDMS